MKKIFLAITLITLVQVLSFAQSSINAYNGFYFGANGGYLLKNASVLNNKAWHLKDGYFGEINAGYKKNNFGVILSIGHLEIKRDPSQFSSFSLNKQSMYDNLTIGAVPPGINWGLNVVSPAFTVNLPAPVPYQYIYKKLMSHYVLAGPEYWIGKGKLKAHIYAQGGAGYTKIGYYYVDGVIKNSENNSVGVTAGNSYDLAVQAQFHQFGMTNKTFTAAMSSSPKVVNDKYVITPIAKAGLDVEYFITPKIALHAGAGAFHLFTPAMKAEENVNGVAVYTLVGPPGTATTENFSYTNAYKANQLNFLYANAGIKIFMGKKAPKPTKTETNPALQTKAVAKDMQVAVKDLPTGLALSGVQIQILKDGVLFNTAVTDENGQIEKMKDLAPGNYEIKGIKNNITTNIARVSVADFEAASGMIFKELVHNDPRFTLIGNTRNRKDNSALSGINTILTNEKTLDVQNQTSDKAGKFIYQLEPNGEYAVVANQRGYFSNIEKATTVGLDRSKTIYATLILGIDELKEGNEFELKNLHYDFNKDNIRPDAANILDRIVDVLNQNSSVEIMLSSHTDSRGDNDYNLKLSQRRAQSAVDYLVSKGISRNRLTAKGYGETKLLNNCSDGVECPEAMHQANRRTEIKILKN